LKIHVFFFKKKFKIDALVGARQFSSTASGGGGADKVQQRVLSTLLNEMDGISEMRDVLVIGATNRPDMLDAALLRPGRFDKSVYVAPPDRTARLAILRLYANKSPLSSSCGGELDAALESIADATELFSGADLAALCREAAMIALREQPASQQHQNATSESDRLVPHVQPIAARHFQAACDNSSPSLQSQQLELFQRFRAQANSQNH